MGGSVILSVVQETIPYMSVGETELYKMQIYGSNPEAVDKLEKEFGLDNNKYQRHSKSAKRRQQVPQTTLTYNTPLTDNAPLTDNSSPTNDIPLVSDTQDFTQINTLLVVNPLKLPAKNMTLFSFEVEELVDFRLRVLQEVRLLSENTHIKSKDMILSYRTTKTGVGTALCVDDDYRKFLEEYKLLQVSQKKKEMTIIVTLKKPLKRKDMSDDEASASTDASEDRGGWGRQKKKKKKKKTKHSGLDKATEEKATKINEIRNRYYCSEHGHPCLIDENGHLKLTAAHLTVWAYDWTQGVAGLDTPPTHPIFRSVQKKKTPIKQLISQSLQSASNMPHYAPPTCTYCHCQQFLPSQHSYHHPFNYMPHHTAKRKTPTMHEFLEELDKTHGEGEFTQYLDIFLENKITISSIKHLNDNYFNLMGIDKIGHRILLLQAAIDCE
ncbi:11573_t:CDS:2 [Paraglomus brasilianum]|uniref:11573_t:CDS:1 n=1 Tax=Paraglomus brasilianum TaxID=144538 RepID=A0A9N9FZG6_9GLOM|nr:11573_t:CDS:2 [Paraglomus brasilianum]